MPYVTVGKENSGDINLYYNDWGSGQPLVVQDPQGRHTENLPGRAARHMHDPQAPDQRGTARVSQVVSYSSTKSNEN